jgi:cathepsin L
MAQFDVKVENGAHFVKMLQNFATNEDIINSHNAGESTYTLGHNQFSHMSIDEFRAYVQTGLSKPVESEAPESVFEAPAGYTATSVDWRGTAVTPVKDQGSCGSCWAFSTTGALEGAYQIKHNKLNSYSEQNFVDCDTRSNGGSDLGCNGGLMDSAFSWAKKNGGVCTEAGYPYVSGTTKKAGTCDQSKCTKDSGVAPSSYTDVKTNDENALCAALDKQPVSVAIEADQSGFQLYKSGVYSGACGTNLDHGVLAVGYNSQAWIVKNSWGSGWGDNGYIQLAIGVSQKQGQCGILSGPPSYPNL